MNRSANHPIQSLAYPDPKGPLKVGSKKCYETWKEAVAQAIRYQRESTEPYNQFYSKVEQLEGLIASEISLFHYKVKDLNLWK